MNVVMLASSVTDLLVSMPKGLNFLLLLMGIDWLTGMLLAGFFNKSGKTPTGGIQSGIGFIGLSKKVMVLFLVMVCGVLDAQMGTSYIMSGAIVLYSVNESISIVENAGLMGVPLPKALLHAIDVLKEQTEGNMSEQ